MDMDFVIVISLVLSRLLPTSGSEGESQHSDEHDEDAAVISDLILGTSSADFFNPCPLHPTGLAGHAFTELINVLIISECLLGAPCAYPINQGGECQLPAVYDFIVVGGGTAGSVIAARLSEVLEWSVLLLEAGGDPTMSTDVPYFYQNLIGSDVDWAFKTQREKGLYNGLMGNVNRWPSGKLLGGTSSISAMLYVRGMPREFDNLAGAGVLGWSYSEVLKYFKKSEDMRDIHILSSPGYSKIHSRGGPLTLSRFGGTELIMEIINNAGISMGIASNSDINSNNLAGFTIRNQGTIKNGERMNTAKAFLNPIKKRKNLHVVKHAYVSKVLICHKTKRAYGVEYYYRNEKSARVVRTKKEIIVSAGTIGSPKILMLSGVGPKHHLEDLNIYVQKDSAVGYNLQDHLMFPGILVRINTGMEQRKPLDYLDQAYQYLTRRKGRFSRTGAAEVLGFINLYDDDSPDILLQFMFFVANETEKLVDFLRGFGIKEDISLQYHEVNKRSDLLIPMPMLLHPKSKGSIQLKSNDTDDMPIIKAGYLTELVDLEYMIRGIRMVEQLIHTQPMKQFNATIEYLHYPGCCGLGVNSDPYWACAISHLAGTGHSQIGTCKMGSSKDSSSVVDSSLKVIGMHGLRVADASVIPNSLSGLPLAPTIMVGEKVSDMIKVDWLPSYQPWGTHRSDNGSTCSTSTKETIEQSNTVSRNSVPERPSFASNCSRSMGTETTLTQNSGGTNMDREHLSYTGSINEELVSDYQSSSEGTNTVRACPRHSSQASTRIVSHKPRNTRKRTISPLGTNTVPVCPRHSSHTSTRIVSHKPRNTRKRTISPLGTNTVPVCPRHSSQTSTQIVSDKPRNTRKRTISPLGTNTVPVCPRQSSQTSTRIVSHKPRNTRKRTISPLGTNTVPVCPRHSSQTSTRIVSDKPSNTRKQTISALLEHPRSTSVYSGSIVTELQRHTRKHRTRTLPERLRFSSTFRGIAVTERPRQTDKDRQGIGTEHSRKNNKDLILAPKG